MHKIRTLQGLTGVKLIELISFPACAHFALTTCLFYAAAQSLFIGMNTALYWVGDNRCSSLVIEVTGHGIPAALLTGHAHPVDSTQVFKWLINSSQHIKYKKEKKTQKSEGGAGGLYREG